VNSWGISENYTPVNFPPTLRRGKDDLAAFYRRLLRVDAASAYEPACGDLKLVEAAELAAGVSDVADFALVVPYTELPRLSTLFPGLRVRRVESANDCWTSEVRLPSSHGFTNVAATRYRHAIVDATADAELWALPPGGSAWPRDAPLPAGQEPPAVDVLLHAPRQTAACTLIDALSRRGWSGRRGIGGCWLQAGLRAEPARLPPPLIAVAPSCLEPFGQVELAPTRLPLAHQAQPWPEAARLAAAAAAAEALDALAPARWGAPLQISFLSRYAAEEVEADTRAGGPVLPLSPARALAWMTDGALQSRRVALVAARPMDTLYLRLEEELKHECLGSEDFAALAAATTEAEAVAFYSNHGSWRCHERATAYAAWARSLAGAAAGARADVRLFVVAGGGRALWGEAERQGLRLSDLFLSWYD